MAIGQACSPISGINQSRVGSTQGGGDLVQVKVFLQPTRIDKWRMAHRIGDTIFTQLIKMSASELCTKRPT